MLNHNLLKPVYTQQGQQEDDSINNYNLWVGTLNRSTVLQQKVIIGSMNERTKENPLFFIHFLYCFHVEIQNFRQQSLGRGLLVAQAQRIRVCIETLGAYLTPNKKVLHHLFRFELNNLNTIIDLILEPGETTSSRSSNTDCAEPSCAEAARSSNFSSSPAPFFLGYSEKTMEFTQLSRPSQMSRQSSELSWPSTQHHVVVNPGSCEGSDNHNELKPSDVSQLEQDIQWLTHVCGDNIYVTYLLEDAYVNYLQMQRHQPAKLLPPHGH